MVQIAKMPLGACVVSLLGACATATNIADEALKVNEALERINNQQLLLNIARASQGLPLHFSRVSAAHLTAGPVNVSAKRSLPALAVAAASNSPTLVLRGAELNLSGPALPGIDVTPLDTQEFMQGMSAPIPLDTLLAFAQLGYPSELLMHLFVESVRTKDGSITNNDPESPRYPLFLRWVRDRNPCRLVPDNVESTARYGPVAALAPARPVDAAGLAAAKGGGLGYAEDATTGSYMFTVRTTAKGMACKKDGRKVDNTRLTAAGGEASNIDDQVSLRSVMSVLSYLGDVVRLRLWDCAAPGPSSPCIAPTTNGPATPLFVLEIGATAKHPSLAVESNGKVYVVPDVRSHSADALALTWHLMQLQNKAGTAPVTGTVRLAQ